MKIKIFQEILNYANVNYVTHSLNVKSGFYASFNVFLLVSKNILRLKKALKYCVSCYLLNFKFYVI